MLPKVTYVTLGNITKLTWLKVEKGIICDFDSGIANHFDIFFCGKTPDSGEFVLKDEGVAEKPGAQGLFLFGLP